MQLKMKNCLPVEVQFANRYKIGDLNVFRTNLGLPTQFVRHRRVEVKRENIFLFQMKHLTAYIDKSVILRVIITKRRWLSPYHCPNMT